MKILKNRVIKLARVRQAGDIDKLDLGLRIEVAMHCMSLARRMQKRITYRLRGPKIVFWMCCHKECRKYRAMCDFYKKHMDDALEEILKES